MLTLAAEAALTAAASRAADPLTFVRWQYVRLLATALVPGTWFLFSLSFARVDSRQAIRRRAWFVAGALLVPLALVLLFPGALYRGVGQSASGALTLPLGWAGQVFELSFLAGCVLVLLNLERTLRASTGSMRWFIKFMTLGVGGLFATRVYTSSQTLLYVAYDESFEAFKVGALIVAALLVGLSLARARLQDAEVYLSAAALHSSFAVGAVGLYLLVVGGLATLARRHGSAEALPVVTFVVFLALLGLTALVLSGEVRHRTRRLVSRHFKRPHYEYREVWRSFTERTGSLLEEGDLARAVARFVSDTLRVPSVTLWLSDDAGETLRPGGSTVYSSERARDLAGEHHPILERVRTEDDVVVDLRATAHLDHGETLEDVRYAALLQAGSETLGLMVLGERGKREPLSLEDLDLLGVMAEQAAASLLNLRLGAQLLKAKEMEAFQSLSAFFVHDLKNLASKLSLTMRNLPAHYDDPGFRDDLLGFMERSVKKINEMCTRLSPLSRGLEIQPQPTDLDALVRDALVGLEGTLAADIEKDLAMPGPVHVDPDEISKVVVNLVLNASEAVGEDGLIRVSTGRFGGAPGVEVSDNGLGMSEDFVRRSLFQPFQTTKTHGLGIGLFHSRKIVEAHGGRIEVQSAEGRGSTFRVLFPSSSNASKG